MGCTAAKAVAVGTVSTYATGMRTAEFINTIFFMFLTSLALLRPLPRLKRVRAVAIGVSGVASIGVALYMGRFLSPLAASVVRDWLPSPLLLMVYWQAGQFFTQPGNTLQSRLLRLDRQLICPLLKWLTNKPTRAWIVYYAELSYFFCYIMVPFGLGVLYLLRRGAYADTFWAAVLPPTYLCYVMVPFFQTLPPRVVEARREGVWQRSTFRSLNLWILRHGSIHANTFPSAHVAASMAAALALFPVAPAVAALFLWAAISIGFGAVIGRYHYFADVLLGAALASGIFVLERLLFWLKNTAGIFG